MKINILLFTQTMHSLLSASLPLQDSLLLCSQILSDKKDQSFSKKLYKHINEGERLAQALSEYKGIFPPVYTSMVKIGEESGTLPLVFKRLNNYVKEKRMLKQKIFQALAYPILVLITAFAVILTLLIFVMPRLKEIFLAFAEASEDIALQMEAAKNNIFITAIILICIIILTVILTVIYKIDKKAAFILDSCLLKIPVLGKIIITMQIYDFSFTMKLLSSTHFPLVSSLEQAGHVLTNSRLKKAVYSVIKKISDGWSTSNSFESEKIFPKYLSSWIKIAEKNGNSAEAFSEICDFYSAENENLLNTITSFAEPFFILVTGIIIIIIISQFVVPIFNLLGAL